MSQAHYEAVRLSSDRPYTTGGGSRRSFLPFRMRPTQSPADVKVSSRFSHPNEDFAKQIMHEHILVVGNRVLAQVQRNTERRIRQTYEELVEAEQKRMEDEYRQKSDEMIRKWQEQLDEEKFKLQQDFDEVLEKMERSRHEKSREEEQRLIRRMKDECDQALAKQWKIANEQLSLAVKQTEDRLRASLELTHHEEKERLTQELIERKEAEYAERESKSLEKTKAVLAKEHAQHVESINERHAREIEALNKKLKLTEERFRREYSSRSRLESDFRLLQTDYKRFMDHSDFFHSDYMLKLCHIGEQIGDAKFEQVLDRILAESNIQPIPPKPIQTQVPKSKHSFKSRNTEK